VSARGTDPAADAVADAVVVGLTGDDEAEAAVDPTRRRRDEGVIAAAEVHDEVAHVAGRDVALEAVHDDVIAAALSTRIARMTPVDRNEVPLPRTTMLPAVPAPLSTMTTASARLSPRIVSKPPLSRICVAARALLQDVECGTWRRVSGRRLLGKDGWKILLGALGGRHRHAPRVRAVNGAGQGPRHGWRDNPPGDGRFEISSLRGP
jgi:hypothetical protein